MLMQLYVHLFKVLGCEVVGFEILGLGFEVVGYNWDPYNLKSVAT